MIVKDVKRRMKSVREVFIAYNSNIDSIIHVDKKMERLWKFKKSNKKLKLPKRIEAPEDFFYGLLYAMSTGAGVECAPRKQLDTLLNTHHHCP